MIFTPIEHSTIALEVENQVENLILEGVLRVGDKLPSERELSKSLNVSRPILRSALASLEERGMIDVKPGGGTYISNIIGTIFAEPVVELIGRNTKAKIDYLEYRKEMESITSAMAAQRATAADKSLLKKIRDEMLIAHEARDTEREARLDVELHTTICECTHNIIFVHTMRSCYKLFSDDVFLNRKVIYEKSGNRSKLLEQHLAICDAVLDGEPDLASKAAIDHMVFIEQNIHDMKKRQNWSTVSEQRLAQRDI